MNIFRKHFDGNSIQVFFAISFNVHADVRFGIQEGWQILGVYSHLEFAVFSEIAVPLGAVASPDDSSLTPSNNSLLVASSPSSSSSPFCCSLVLFLEFNSSPRPVIVILLFESKAVCRVTSFSNS